MRPHVIALVSGEFFDLANPDPAKIHIEDIAHSLSLQARWTGHTKRLYSVAQHCVHVSRLVPARYALEGLLHDASEAYIGDISTPMKQYLEDLAPGAVVYAEALIHATIADKFGTSYPHPLAVHEADMVSAATERRDLLEPWAFEAGDWPAPHPDRIRPQSPVWARRQFLRRFRELTR